MLYIDVILPLAFSGQIFTYLCPETIAPPQIGARVKVPFITTVKTAVVAALHHNTPSYKTRAILEVIDQNPIISAQQIDLMRWIADYYICPLGQVLKNTLPTAIRSATYTPPTRTAYKLCTDKNLETITCLIAKRKAAQKALSAYLGLQTDENNPHAAVAKKVLLENGATDAGLKFLIEQGVFLSTTIDARKYNATPNLASKFTTEISASILAQQSKPSLLFNTAEPQQLTDIICGLIEQTAIKGETALIITPDTFSSIALSDRLSLDFEVVEYHPRVSPAKRNEAYMRICNHPNTLDVIVGTRNATLLPLTNLGLVIVVEEGDFGHKSDQSPMLNSRDVALVLANQHNAKCVLTTSAPSLEAYAMCRMERWEMVKINGTKKNASVKLLEKGRKILFSKYMLRRIEETIEQGNQIIVFQNRRGFASSVVCDDCGYIPQCLRCNVMLTLHTSDHTMRCHYCGYQIAEPKLCPGCSSTNIKPQGMGTERVTEELGELFPQAKIARVDSDSVARRDAFGELTRDVEDAKAEIIVGTQLILRGLKPQKATLAIVVNADNMFLSTDFRTSERAMSSLVRLRSMVSDGELIIQSWNTKNPVLKALEWDEVSDFYRQELEQRQELGFAPFFRMIIVRLYCAGVGMLLNSAAWIDGRLQQKFGNRASAPYEPVVDKIQGRFILEVMLRLERDGALGEQKMRLKEVVDEFRKNYSTVEITVDVDPV